MTGRGGLSFGVIGIDHPHVYEQVGRLLDLGCPCVGWYADGEPPALTAFRQQFPHITRVADHRDVRERTETAMPQSHCFKAMELALAAQAGAVRLG